MECNLITAAQKERAYSVEMLGMYVGSQPHSSSSLPTLGATTGPFLKPWYRDHGFDCKAPVSLALFRSRVWQAGADAWSQRIGTLLSVL